MVLASVSCADLYHGNPLTVRDKKGKASMINSPTITASAASASAGDPISASAILSGATTDATGYIVFTAYPAYQPTCSGGQIYSMSVTVVGNQTYSSGNFIPDLTPAPTVGNYYWTISYSGDANNNPVTTNCGDPTSSVS